MDKLRKLFPQKIRNVIKFLLYSFKLFPEFIFWFKNDLLQSNLFPNRKSELAALMVKSHVLEKGITMPNRRLGFGYDRVREILRDCRLIIKNYSANYIEMQMTLNDLEQYLQLHKVHNFPLPADISMGIQDLLKYKEMDTVVYSESTPELLFKKTNDFYEFAHSRHSVRWYSGETIDSEILLKVLELAQTAPSACNRQSTKVYIIDTKEKKEDVLRLQNGNRGFGYMADKILLVTSDMKCWGYKTRTSAYLDAGIFTQNLLYALHYYEICACTLNAHLSIKQRKELNKIVGYSKSEIPIVFISIGKAPEHFMIAGSQRLQTKQIYEFV